MAFEQVPIFIINIAVDTVTVGKSKIGFWRSAG